MVGPSVNFINTCGVVCRKKWSDISIFTMSFYNVKQCCPFELNEVRRDGYCFKWHPLLPKIQKPPTSASYFVLKQSVCSCPLAEYQLVLLVQI